MTTGVLCPLIIPQFAFNNGQLAAGGYIAPTVGGVPTAVYQDSGLTTPLPLVAIPNQSATGVPLNSRGEISNASGASCQLFLTPNIVYTFTLFDASGNQIWVATYVNGTLINQATVGGALYPENAAEIAAGVTIVAIWNPYQTAIRYANNGTPGTTNMSGGIQAAIDSASQSSAEVKITDLNGLSVPLLIRATSQQNLSVIGNGRVSTILLPLAANLSTAPQNVNAMIINQANNGHLHLKGLRCFDSVGFTGVFFYAVEGGCADGSGQAAFSMVVDDCWLSLSSNNSGYFQGGFSNLRVSKTVYESTKTACWRLQGAGNSDQQYVGNVMNDCFDSFIYANDDTLTKAMISVVGLHAYQHQRGPLISITKGVEMVFEDIILEPAIGNAGTTGLFQFTDCTDVVCTDFEATTANTEPLCAIGINLINSFSGKFSDGKITATVGLQLSGTGALDLTLDNVDFLGCGTAIQMLSGTLSGDIYLRQCRLNNMQLYGIITLAGTASFNLTLEDCEVVNAGLGGTVTTRNLDLTTSGNVRLIRTKIGQNNAGAAAQFYIRANGSGSFSVIDPQVVGVAPSGFATGAQAITYDGIDSLTPNFTSLMGLTPGGTATVSPALNRWSLKQGILTFYADITVTALGSGSQTSLSGLPFSSSSVYYGGGVVHFFAGIATSVVSLNCDVAPAGTSLTFRSLTVAAATPSSANPIIQTGARVIIEGSYPL